MVNYTHKCIKCQGEYTDSDPDAYFCPPCVAVRKDIARQIDESFATKPKKQVQSRFSEKDFKGKSGRIFFNLNDVL